MITTQTKAPVATVLLVAITIAAVSSTLGLSAAYLGVVSSRRVAQPRQVYQNVNANVNQNVNASRVEGGLATLVNRSLTGTATLAGTIQNCGSMIPRPGEVFTFIRGNVNYYDCKVDISDAVKMSRDLPMVQADLNNNDPQTLADIAPVLCMLDVYDVNDDGKFDANDISYLLNYLFQGGLKPAVPFPEVGTDPTADAFICSSGPEVAFSDNLYRFTVSRDYNQTIELNVRNLIGVQQEVSVNLDNTYPDVVLGFISEGSRWKLAIVAPYEIKTITLAFHAQDADPNHEGPYIFIAELRNKVGAIMDTAQVEVTVQ